MDKKIKPNQLPKITIVTPNYNLGSYLEQTILSIINQGYPNLEYIIIDGGSTDNSIEIIKKYEQHLTYWTSEPDNGMYHAIQKGFDRSTGEIMAWLNSDDLFHQGALHLIANLFNTFDDVLWVQGLPSNFNINGAITAVYPIKKWTKYHYYTHNYKWIQQESIFWRRSLWNKTGGYIDTSYKLAGDFELWTRFFRCTSLYSTTILLGGFRIRGEQQLSIGHLKSYEQEVTTCLNQEINSLSTKEKFNTLLFRILSYVLSLLRYFKIFNIKGIENNLISPLFGGVKFITYDAIEKKFIR